MDAVLRQFGRQERKRVVGPDFRLPDISAAAEIERHFRENYPILLDGALPLGSPQGHFVRQARESLSRGGADSNLMPAAMLRETLDAIAATPAPVTAAGITAVGPGHARIWWDNSLLDNLDDILSGLDRPRPILRFFDVTDIDPEAGRWHESFDLDVALNECGRTVEFWRPGREYAVDLGYCYADGRFLRLARTNTALLPRDGGGEAGDPLMVRSNLRPPPHPVDRAPIPDARAREWADLRPDHAARDVEAELIVHMLYRAFLVEGPRSLRRAARPQRREGDVLLREFVKRNRIRARGTSPVRVKKTAPTFLVARLDVSELPEAAVRNDFLPVPATRGIGSCLRCARESTFDTSAFLCRRAVSLAVSGHIAGISPLAVLAPPVSENPVPEESMTPCETGGLVRNTDAVVERSLAVLASPVFDAARDLHRRLSGFPLTAAVSDVSAIPSEELRKAPARNRDFGGAEARRFAKAGVRISRMALTLEGRMRPGAKLKVAGKLVYADADGRFRLECVLTGRKASIPLRAGTSIGGEARSVINVEWEQRAKIVKA